MTLALSDGSLFTRLGVEPSGVLLISPESVETNVRPELSEVEAEGSDGDEIPDRKLLLPEKAGGYNGLNGSLSNSNSRMMRFDSRAASVLSPVLSQFPGAVIWGRWAAHQHVQALLSRGSVECSSGNAVPGAPQPESMNTWRFSACSSGVKAASLRYWMLSNKRSAW